MRKCGLAKVKKEQVDTLWAGMDTNSSGGIEFKEFCDLIFPEGGDHHQLHGKKGPPRSPTTLQQVNRFISK